METSKKWRLLTFSEILHVLLINGYEKVCGNCFIFSQSADIKKNVKKVWCRSHAPRSFRFLFTSREQKN